MFSKDSQTLISAHYQGEINLWNPETGENLVSLGGKGEASNLALSSDGKILIGIYMDKLTVWNLEQHQKLWEKEGTIGSSYSCAAISPDGKTFATGDYDGKLKLWNIETSEQLLSLKHEQAQEVTAVAFLPDGKTAASGGDEGTIRIWNLETKKLERCFAGKTKGITAMVISPNGDKIISGTKEGTIEVWG